MLRRDRAIIILPTVFQKTAEFEYLHFILM